MAEESEEKPSTSHDFASTKAAIFNTFNKWQKWRDEQLQEFLSKQYLDSQKLLQLSSEGEKQVLENSTKGSDPEDKPKLVPDHSEASCLSLEKDFDICDTLQESSITGHLQRCFDDSSQSNLSVNQNKINAISSVVEKIPIFSEIRNLQFLAKKDSEKEEQLVKEGVTNGPSVKAKRPFLRKGSGLIRYMPKSTSNGQEAKKKVFSKANNPSKKSTQLPQKTLKLKSAIHKADARSEHVKHIKFKIPVSGEEENAGYVDENSLPSAVPKLNGNANVKFGERNKHSPSSSNSFESSSENSKFEDANSESESLNLSKENKELAEFEMLENCVQNSSFTSDSSIVQRILHGDSNKQFHSVQKDTMKPSENVVPICKEIFKNMSESSSSSDKIGLNKCLSEVQARKQMLQKVISDINPRIQSLQKEISSSKQEALDDSDMSERCSTPIEDLSFEEKILSSIPENGSTDAYGHDVNETICETDCKCCNIDSVKNLYANKESLQNVSYDEEESVSEVPDNMPEDKKDLDGKSKIREKLLELEKEIETYQQLNAKLSSLCKERDEIVRKLQKERDDFNKNKEAEKKKLEGEIQEERRQIKRQKESFMRFQKLRKDHPTRKEREELNSLRQEVEKLQEELKRQKIKYTSDCRRWKTRIDAAEKERDSFKLENIRLEEQCQDLLAVLKTRLKKKPESKSLNDDDKEDNMQENIMKDIPMSKDSESQTQTKELDSNVCKDSSEVTQKSTDAKKAKTKFNFTSTPMNELEILSKDVENKSNSPSTNEKLQSENENVTTGQDRPQNSTKNAETDNLSVISISGVSEFKEIDHGNRTERIFTSGEREIIFNSGTRKYISADGKLTKFYFYNGDIKEIFPDRREVYRYVNGVTETQFPDGLKVTEFPNGQTQRRYPDGQKEVGFPDGTVHNIRSDGSEEIHSANGNVVNLSADGTKTIQFANGQREIRTDTYKRREFPDGSVKIIYDSGRQETRYSNGRVRIKDKEGKVLFDTKYLGIPKG